MKEGPLREILAELGISVITKNASGWLLAHCPFAEWTHANGYDRQADFYVKPEDAGISAFHCFACKQKGRISSLVRKLEHFRRESYGTLSMEADGAETPDEFERWEDRPATFVPDPDPLDKNLVMSMYPMAWENETAMRYLASRGISRETAETLELQFDDDEARILFPVFDERHQLYGYTGRSTVPEEERKRRNYPKVRDYAGLPKEHLLLGEQLVDPAKPFWVVEGLFAFAHLIDIGCASFVNVVATMKSTVSSYQRARLVAYGKPIFLGYDNDEAGEVGIYGPIRGRDNEGRPMFGGNGAFDLLSPHVPTFIPLYPEGKDDPDDLTYEEVWEMFTEAQQSAFSLDNQSVRA